MQFINSFYQRCLLLTKKIRKSAVSAYSGQTAFFLILSFFPFVLFLLTLLKYTPLTEETALQSFIFFIPSSFQPLISQVITEIYQKQSPALLSVTIITAIWLGSKAFLSLIQGMNSVYEDEENRNFFILRFLSVFYTILFALLILTTLALLVFGNTIYFMLCRHFPLLNNVFLSIISLRPIVSFIIMFLFFSIMYKFLPNRKATLKSQFPGALLATSGWISFSYLYSYYVDHFNRYSAFYGTMTMIALLMIWLYACMYLLFLGGILNHSLE